MARPTGKRQVKAKPPCGLFKPAGIPAKDLDEVQLTVDEYEAIRLVDYEGLYQEQAAEAMDVSRQTLGRILELARRKVGETLVQGKSLRIEGGEYFMGQTRCFVCPDCKHRWTVAYGVPRPETCPKCPSRKVVRCDAKLGQGRGRRGCGKGRCRRLRYGKPPETP
jgi:predicted DNA-binding protein (UPF0251 family)